MGSSRSCWSSRASTVERIAPRARRGPRCRRSSVVYLPPISAAGHPPAKPSRRLERTPSPGPRALALAAVQMAHHAGPSGYDDALVSRLQDGVPAAYLVSDTGAVLGHLPGTVRRQLVRRLGRRWYKASDLLLEEGILIEKLTKRDLVIHILYGENTYSLSGLGRTRALRRGNRLIATFHQPPDVLRRVGPTAASLKRLDKVITLSRSQTGYFDSIVGSDRVVNVPHGVDTEYFVPDPSSVTYPEPTCLVVGQWLRDWTTLVEAAKELGRKGVTVRVLSPAARASEALGEIPTVTLLSRLSDAALREEYRRSHLLLMPLKDSAANNAVLEGLACGLPSVVSDVGGVRDYVDDTCGVLVPPRDPASMASAALRLLEDGELRASLGLGARQQSLTFSWPRVVAMLRSEYESLY